MLTYAGVDAASAVLREACDEIEADRVRTDNGFRGRQGWVLATQ